MLAVSCPYEENAIRAITAAAIRRDRLAVRYAPDLRLPAAAAGFVARLPGAPDAVGGYAAKPRTRGLGSALSQDRPTSALSEPLRLLGARWHGPLTHRVGNYLWKRAFDRATARAHRDTGISVLIGMPGASRDTFARSGESVRRVLHEVDAHPRVHNQRLVDVYGRRRALAELYPDAHIARIEQELDLCDAVLVPSAEVGGQMAQHGVPGHKIELLPYGVDLDRFAPPSGARRPGPPRVLFVGQLSLRKGVPLLLRAARGLAIELILVGQVFDRSLLADLPGNTRLVGPVGGTELARLYGDCDALVLPTIEDACALVVAEAAATGTRVITTTANGAHELLGSAHRVIPAADLGALRAALRDVAPLDAASRAGIAAEARGERRLASWSHYGDAVLDRLGER